jgi:hypothetical protein
MTPETAHWTRRCTHFLTKDVLEKGGGGSALRAASWIRPGPSQELTDLAGFKGLSGRLKMLRVRRPDVDAVDVLLLHRAVRSLRWSAAGHSELRRGGIRRTGSAMSSA